jgi:hypothetical protein
MARRNNNANAQSIEAKEKAARALELRKEGKTFEEIAAETGYSSRQAAYDAVKRAMSALTREPATELLELELARLDTMWGAHYIKAQRGDVQALAACMRIMERRAKLLGLDAPDKSSTELTGPDGGPVALPTVIQLVGVRPKQQAEHDENNSGADRSAG